MLRLNRRSFLAASAALVARPAIAALATSSAGVEVVIVGAGAAGIAAARHLAAAGRRFVLIEASDHIGGRCITDTRTFGVPYDLGAHWIHSPDVNPLAKLAPRHDVDVYPTPASQKVRVGRRYAREGELEDFQAAQVRAAHAIADAAHKADVSCEQALPADLGDWRSTIQFVLGPFGCGKDLARLSAADFAHAPERVADAFCREGYGTLLSTLARGIPVQLSTPATAIDTSRNVAVQTPQGTITARAAIVTVSTNMLASGRIQFTPELPSRTLDACGKLSLGSYDHIAVELEGNPLGLENDDLVFEKPADTHTAALLANVSGTPLCLIDVAGSFGHDLSAQGEAAMADFAREWLVRLFGADVKKAIKRVSATRWNSEQWTLGAASAAAPGGQAARRILSEPVHDMLWFAGEAAHETLWGTVGGAWESGERAADAAVHYLSTLKEAAPTLSEALPVRRVNPLRAETPNILRDEP